jgi:hypothetical protein
VKWPLLSNVEELVNIVTQLKHLASFRHIANELICITMWLKHPCNFSLIFRNELVQFSFNPNKWICASLLVIMLQPWPWARDQSKGLQGCGPRGRPESPIKCCKECEGMNLHIPKWTPIVRVGVSNGLSNLQNAIARAKTHRLEVFFISLESY